MRRYELKQDGVECAHPRYICNNGKHCGTGSCIASELMDSLKATLKEHIADFEVQLKNNQEGDTESQQRLIEQLEQRLERLNAKEIAHWYKYTQEDMPKHVFYSLNERLLAEK